MVGNIDSEIQCPVCERMHIPLFFVGKKLNEDYAISQMDQAVCSEECLKVLKETSRNTSPFCGKCGKELKHKWQNAVYFMDYTKKVSIPKCCECEYPEDWQEMEELFKNEFNKEDY